MGIDMVFSFGFGFVNNQLYSLFNFSLWNSFPVIVLWVGNGEFGIPLRYSLWLLHIDIDLSTTPNDS